MRNSLAVVAIVGLLAVALPADAQINARMLRYPDVSETQISFVYAGDIWLVPKEGGLAHRLSSPPGEEMLPRFSPDGRRIAFTARYDGNPDVYVLPITGGRPKRITHHPSSDRLIDWYPDGQSLLISSPMKSASQRFNQLYRVAADGGLPAQLPMPYGEFGAVSPDGRSLAFQTLSRDFRTWKRYRGGTAPDIWLFDLETLEATNITSNDANDAQPMWAGRTLYFLSDRGPRMRANIWARDMDTGEFRQVTEFSDDDVRFPAIGPVEIVFEAGGDLWLLDLESESYDKVPVQVVTDRSTLRPRNENVAELIEDADISPSGKRAVFSARGELFTIPAEHGVIRNLTRSSGTADRYPTWSPDGTQIAYWSDADGEYELYLVAADGSGEASKLTDIGPGFRYRPMWSPDGTKIVFMDHEQRLRLLDVESKKLEEFDRALYMSPGGRADFTVSWSADSRWVAYSRNTEQRTSAIYLYDTSAGALHQVTSAFYNDLGPVFDPDGSYLFFFTNRSYEPIYGDFDGTWTYANATHLAAVSLRGDVASPLAPRNDEEEGTEKEDDENDKASSEDENADDEAEKEVEAVEIDLDGFEMRIVILPPEPGNWGRLAAVSGKILYIRSPRRGAAAEDSPLMLWDLEEREEETILENVDDFTTTPDGSKLLVVANDSYAIIEPEPGQKMDKELRTAEIETIVDPGAEWGQIFDEVWRVYRDFFYDPAMHGVDWPAMKAHYGELLDDAATRTDVNFVIGELIGELNASHTYRGGGDLERAPSRPVGLLGCDWQLADGFYQIAHIVRGEPWETEVRSPLDQPGVDVSQGDYLLAVNGEPVDVTRDPWAAFQGLAEETVLLTVNDQPTFEDSREVLVDTLGSEARLRNLSWIAANRHRVDELSNGRVGYIFVPDTGLDGQNELVRQFYAQASKDGLIIDERFNSGGQYPDRFIELMMRRRTGYVAMRHGPDLHLGTMSRTGPQVMLVNSWAGSGGDAFPFLFREAGLGPIIGTRTWGGLIGYSGIHRLVDGGYVTLTTLGLYTSAGEWMLEGHGLEPDIEVIDDPGIMARGVDPQLERAIEEVVRLVETAPPSMVDPPPYGDRTADGNGS